MTYHKLQPGILTPREAIGAVLRIGVAKSQQFQKGVRKERAFSFILPHRDDSGDRPLHPDFAAYNRLAEKARTVVRGNLTSETQYPDENGEGGAMKQFYGARVLGPRWQAWPKSPPSGRWVCHGDGKNATRLHGVTDGEEDWREIPCPARLCEFAQSVDGKRPLCTPKSTFIFQPRWGDWWPQGEKRPPEIRTKFETGSPNTGANLSSFFDEIHREAEPWFRGLPYSLYGLPFVMNLVERTKPSEKRRWPEVIFSVDGSLAKFFAAQRKLLEDFGGQTPALIGAGDEPEAETVDSMKDLEQAIEVEATDVTPGVPGQEGLW